MSQEKANSSCSCRAKCNESWSRPDHQGCCRKFGFTEQTKGNPGSNLTRKMSDEIWLDKSHSSCKTRNELERSAIQKNSEGVWEAIWERDN